MSTLSAPRLPLRAVATAIIVAIAEALLPEKERPGPLSPSNRLFALDEQTEFLAGGRWHAGRVVSLRLTSRGLYYGIESVGWGAQVPAAHVRPASDAQAVRITGIRLDKDGVLYETAQAPRHLTPANEQLFSHSRRS